MSAPIEQEGDAKRALLAMQSGPIVNCFARGTSLAQGVDEFARRVARATRDFDHFHPEALSRAVELEARMAQNGAPVFCYCVWRSLDEQAQAVAGGVSWTRRGYHNLRDPDTGLPASRAGDWAFVGASPFARGHPWALLCAEAERVGLWGEALHKGDLGHFVYAPEPRDFAALWAAQAHHHPIEGS
jgi:hypothetical protein